MLSKIKGTENPSNSTGLENAECADIKNRDKK